MKLGNLRISNGLSIIILASLVLVACGGGASSYTSASSNAGGTPSPAPSGPAISLSATPVLVAYNGTATVAWSSPESNSCTSSPAGINTKSGSLTTPPLTSTTTYTVTCTGSTGTSSKSVTIIAGPTSIANVSAAWAAEPMRGTVHYYCDCGTGASPSCVPGNDANDGLSTATPRRTIAAAAANFSTLAAYDTVALCKGGAFDAAAQLQIGSNRCPAGVACNDLREFTPTTFIGTASPIINKSAAYQQLFFFNGVGGVRVLNLYLNGVGAGATNFGVWAYNGAKDIVFGNVDLVGFNLAVYNDQGLMNDGFTLSGSRISQAYNMGYLGGGKNVYLSYNYWDHVGGDTTFDHALYIGGHGSSNINVIGNYIKGQSSPTCLGAVILGHAEIDGLTVSGNTIDINVAENTNGCWGIAFDWGGYTTAIGLKNSIFSNNIIKNAGNNNIAISNCSDCLIENNLIINEGDFGAVGISIANVAARTSPADGLSTRNKIRNNTIWYGPNAKGGGVGISVKTEGTGHVIANNSIYYQATTATYGFSCYNFPLALSAYAFINNNHCFSAAAYNWEATRGSLASWRAYAVTPGFDTASITSNPMFKAVGTDFTPDTGSPLIPNGNSTYGTLSDINGKARANPPAIGAFEP